MEQIKDFKYHCNRVQNYFNNFGMRRYLSLLATRASERFGVSVVLNPVGSDGTSSTDSKNIVFTLWIDFLDKSLPVIKSYAEASVGHEGEHIRSSDFPTLMNLMNQMGNYYFNKYNIDKRIGSQLGATLYNCIEDGRIERIYTNRFPGSIESFQLLNGHIWRTNAIKTPSQSIYADFISAILTISKTGVKPKNWDLVYAGSEADDVLNDISVDIYETVNSNFTSEVAQNVLVINQKIEQFIVEGLKNQDKQLKEMLEKMADAGYDVSNSNEKQQSQADSNGGAGSSAHIAGGNQSAQDRDGQGSGQGAKEALDKASSENVSTEEIERKIAENQEKIEQDTSAQDIIDKGEKEKANEDKNSRDDSLSKDELNKISSSTKIDVGDASIKDYQEAINNASNTVELSSELSAKGDYIYNQLKKLFIRRDTKDIRNLKRGKLDSKKLARYTAFKNSGNPETNIFKKNSKDIIPEVAVYGIADISGSTSGVLFNKILETLSVIEDGFGRLIPLKLSTFAGGGSRININVLKDFKNRTRRVNYSYNFAKAETSGGGTPTAEAMAIAGYELNKRKERKKLMFIITDGEPNDRNQVFNMTKDLRKKGIKVVAILISDYKERVQANFKEMYDNKDFICVNDDIFAPTLIKIISSWIES